MKSTRDNWHQQEVTAENVVLILGAFGVAGVVAFLIYFGFGKFLAAAAVMFGFPSAPFLISPSVRSFIVGMVGVVLFLAGIGVMIALGFAVFFGVLVLFSKM